MKRTYPQSVAEIIDTLLKENHLEENLLMHRALSVWPTVVGNYINRHTVERRVAGGVVYLRIPSAAVRQELTMHRDALIQALNEAVGQPVIHDIKFM